MNEPMLQKDHDSLIKWLSLAHGLLEKSCELLDATEESTLLYKKIQKYFDDFISGATEANKE